MFAESRQWCRGRRRAAPVAAALCLTLFAGRAVGSAPGPTVRIVEPTDGVKLHDGTTAVRIRVDAGDSAIEEWALTLVVPTGDSLLARGNGVERDRAVATVRVRDLPRGASYRLFLEARDVAGRRSSTESTFSIPDPKYTAIPLEPTVFSMFDFISIDASGRVVATGKGPSFIDFLDSSSGTVERVNMSALATGGLKLSPDGNRFFYKGDVLDDGKVIDFGLAFYDRAQRSWGLVSHTPSFYFSVDRSGNLIAFESDRESAPPGPQYFLFDARTKETRQLTDDPEAIVFPDRRDACPRFDGTTPMINAEGTRVAVATRAALGLVEPDSNVGCHIAVYDVAEQAFRYVTGLPKELTLARPAISADGRWLSFVSSRALANGLRLNRPSLLDLDTGQLQESLTPLRTFTSFDSVVTGDGSQVVVSSQDDLDPRVGNPDHNMDLFSIDRLSGEATQVTDTTGGIDLGSGTCPALEPAVNHDGSVIAMQYGSGEEEPCVYFTPPRHASTGLFYVTTRIVRKRPGNAAPVWTHPSELRVTAGETVAFDLTATDADGDPISFFAQERGGIDIPRGATIEDDRHGRASFRWPTRIEQAGTYVLRVAVFDEGGSEQFADVTITVAPRGASGCAGDCDGDAVVAITELMTAVAVAQQTTALAACQAADVNRDGAVTVEELIGATGQALNGCTQP